MNHFQGSKKRMPALPPQAQAQAPSSRNTSRTSMQGFFMKNPQHQKPWSSVLAALMLLAAGSASAGVSWSIGIGSSNVVVVPRPPAVVYEAAPTYLMPAPVYPVPPRVLVAPPVIYQPPPVALRIDQDYDPYRHHMHDDDCDDY
ncbi:hypothetical protein [Variovorax atrisoli]|uniref:hypothetical protein n=1 Tax=Variovorax atrisoli TaxID=3394203 RepID=UPI0012FDF7AA|nr:hypothetical protein [Variovorax paradoxus]